MNHIFISHSSKDALLAQSLAGYLESHGHRCWIAPRDIAIGLDYTDVINSALENCHTLIFLISKNSLDSTWAKKELSTAMSLNKKVLPFKIDKSEISSGFLFMLNNVQIIDAVNDPCEKFSLILNQLPYINSSNNTSYNSITPINNAKYNQNKKSTTPPIIITGAVVLLLTVLIIILSVSKTSQESDSDIISNWTGEEKTSTEGGFTNSEGSLFHSSTNQTRQNNNSFNGTLPRNTTSSNSDINGNTSTTNTVSPEDPTSTETNVNTTITTVEQPKPQTTTPNIDREYESRLNSAISLYANGDYLGALNKFESLKRSNPNDSRPTKYISLCKKKLKASQ